MSASSLQGKFFLYLALSVPIHALLARVFAGLRCVGSLPPSGDDGVAAVDVQSRSACVRDFPLSLGDFLTLVAGKDSPGYDPAFLSLSGNAGELLVYVAVACVLGGVLGASAGRLVEKWGLHVRFRFLDTRPTWWVYLSGDRTRLSARKLIDTDDVAFEGAFSFVLVTAATDTAAGTYLYWGLLKDFELDSGGQLKRLTLRNARRRQVENDEGREEGGEDRFYQVDGDLFVLEYDRVINLNIQYLDVAFASATDDDFADDV